MGKVISVLLLCTILPNSSFAAKLGTREEMAVQLKSVVEDNFESEGERKSLIDDFVPLLLLEAEAEKTPQSIVSMLTDAKKSCIRRYYSARLAKLMEKYISQITPAIIEALLLNYPDEAEKALGIFNNSAKN